MPNHHQLEKWVSSSHVRCLNRIPQQKPFQAADQADCPGSDLSDPTIEGTHTWLCEAKADYPLVGVFSKNTNPYGCVFFLAPGGFQVEPF